MITQRNIDNVDELAIFPLIEGYAQFFTPEEVLDKDTKHWTGINFTDWGKVKGKKSERFYTIEIDGEKETVIRSSYDYTLSGWEVVEYDMNLDYLKPDGTIGLRKNIKSEKGHGKIVKLNRNIKLGLIDDLRDRGKKMKEESEKVPEPYKTFFLNISESTDDLLNHYYDLIHRECIDFTWDPWISKINSDLTNKFESDGITYTEVYKKLVTPASADGQTLVKDIILSEITI